MDKRERKRLQKLLAFEGEARTCGYQMIAGIDEAGRGPLAGPVYAAACIVPEGLLIPGVDDSKKLSREMREEVYAFIISEPRIVYSIQSVDHEEIDRINILRATIQAMLLAVDTLAVKPDFLLVDGLHLPHPDIPCKKVIKGDTLSQSIAAASVLAKVARDAYMRQLHLSWPEYGFEAHKGYATGEHLRILRMRGPCPCHRRSFEPVKSMVQFDRKEEKQDDLVLF